ncbi:MAG: RIP metalloprotease RseP [Burkholderiales bacterium]
MTTLFAFVLTLAVLIIVHEWGHYRVARACDVKVLRFSVGFGRPLWRRQLGETEWVVGALPLGGYVKMLDEREGVVAPAEAHRAFNRKTLWQRAAIVAAGPVANLLLAVVLYAAAHWIGTDEPRALLATPTAQSLAERAGLHAGDWVRGFAVDGDDGEVAVASLHDLRWLVTRAALSNQDVRLSVSDATGHGRREVLLPLSMLEASDADPALMRRIGIGAPYADPVLGRIMPGGAADRAGLRSGDRVLTLDGQPMTDAAQLRNRIRDAAKASAPQTQHWRVQRSGQVLEIDVTPAAVDDQGQRIGRIEAIVGNPPQMDRVSYGPIDGLTRAASRTYEMAELTLRMFGRMLIGQASLRNISGPLTIADYAGQSVQLGLAYYLGFLAVVSISLGVLNLLPLPMLDGGHLLYYLVEGVIGRPIPDVWIERLQRGGLLVIVTMMSLALYNDVARLMGLH